MDTKLTLKIDKRVVDKAKDYAKSKNISVSYIVENYLKTITQTSIKKDNDIISPIVDSLSGIIHLPDNYDYREDYYNHLLQKHK